MFTFKKEPTPSPVQPIIDELIAFIVDTDQDSKEYAAAIDQLSKLYKMKEFDTPNRRVSPETIAMIAANFAGLLLVLNHERLHVIGSKAFGMVFKAK